MSQFRFRLQALLDYRQRREDDLRRRLGELERLMQREQNTLADLERGRREVAATYTSLEESAFDVEKAQLLRSYYSLLSEQIDRQQHVIAELGEALSAQRGKVVKAMRERKIVQNLRDRHLEQFNIEELRKEQALLDDLATSRYVNNQVTYGSGSV